MKRPLTALRRWVFPIVWWARDQESDALDQSAWRRGMAYARQAAAHGRVFGLFTAVSTVALPSSLAPLLAR
jgi:hypothetical protein